MMMPNLPPLDLAALILVIIGAFNWGLIGLLELNLVHRLFGDMLSRLVYLLVGAAGIYLAIILVHLQRVI